MKKKCNRKISILSDTGDESIEMKCIKAIDEKIEKKYAHLSHVGTAKATNGQTVQLLWTDERAKIVPVQEETTASE